MSKTEETTPPVAARDAAGPPPIDERYRIEREIGRGGMGRVFVAHDRKLGRDVAIKVLASGLHGKEALRRFEQEARATCALNHANILDVHDIGTHEGRPYIVSELLHGITLRERLRRRPLPVKEASGYALQLAQGLSAAHEKGIVHRDLKPDNLFITEEGRLKILDFGIAKLLAPVTPETGETLPSPQPHTEEGAILGTVGYMSPEQVRGQPADQRSDVFSFGAIVYEMLAGHGAFERNTAVETGYAILKDEPSSLPAEVPSWLARIVERCLAKRPEDRFKSGRELRDVLAAAEAASEVLARSGRTPYAGALQRTRLALLLAGIGVLAAGPFLYLLVRGIAKPISSAPAPAADQAAPSIAVLPFADLSPNKDQEYFSDGVAEEILDLLSKVHGLHVAARTSAFSFKGKNEDARSIAEKLNVAALLEGSVRKVGDRIRITTQLINAKDGYYLWSKTYDRKLSDIFAVQDEIGQAVVAALKLKLMRAPNVQEGRTANPDAFNEYLLGKQFVRRGDAEDFRRALQSYERAVALDPGYAAAWAGLALASYWVSDSDWESAAAIRAGQDRALESADKAVVLGPDLPEGYSARAFVRVLIKLDFEGGNSDLQRALALKPDDADALETYSQVILRPLGRSGEAIAAARKATELDPLNAQAWSVLGLALAGAGQFAASREAYDRSLQISPEQNFTPYRLALNLLADGQPAAALAAGRRSTDEGFRLVVAAMAEHSLGHAAESQRALDDVIARFGTNVSYQIVQIYAWRGETDRAFEWLERAREQRDGGLISVKADPTLHKLRGDPRYVTLLKKLNLPVDW